MRVRRLAASLGLAIGLVGLGIDWSVVFPSVTAVSPTNPVARSWLDAFFYFWVFFTHLTNLGLVLIYLAELAPWRWLGVFRTPLARASMVANITLVMLFFHFMLAPTYQFTGALAVGNVILHYVAPLCYLAWWAALASHGTLRLSSIPAMLAPGLIYLVVVMLRGAVTNEYPYGILDAYHYGYGQVAIGAGIVIACVAIFSVLVVLVDRPLARLASPVQPRNSR